MCITTKMVYKQDAVGERCGEYNKVFPLSCLLYDFSNCLKDGLHEIEPLFTAPVSA